MRASASEVLADEGYVVATASSLEVARGKLELERFSCVVLDLGLPDGTADALLRELVDRESSPAVIVMSAAQNTADVARHYGVLYLVKPFDLDVLVAAVKVAVSQRMRPFVRASRDAPTVRLRPLPR